jgi:hypothetical protein
MDYEGCYKVAFAIALREIQGADAVDVFGALNESPGDLPKQAKSLVNVLGCTGWKWRPFDSPLFDEKDYLKMSKAVASRVENLAHALYRREQLSEVTEFRPYWEFKAGIHELTPQHCLNNDGLVIHFSDPIWQEFLPPCESPYCQCQVFSLSERDISRKA